MTHGESQINPSQPGPVPAQADRSGFHLVGAFRNQARNEELDRPRTDSPAESKSPFLPPVTADYASELLIRHTVKSRSNSPQTETADKSSVTYPAPKLVAPIHEAIAKAKVSDSTRSKAYVPGKVKVYSEPRVGEIGQGIYLPKL